MGKFILKRLLLMIPTLWIILTIVLKGAADFS